MIDNSDIKNILDKLENLEDEELAVKLLQEFNRASKNIGQLLLNLDKDLSHDDWKNQCDEAQKKLDDIIRRINNC